MVNKTFQYREELPFKFKIFGLKPLNSTAFKNSKLRIIEFEEFEEERRKLSEAKNFLEAYVYTVNELTSNDNFVSHTTSEDLENLKKMASDVIFLKRTKNGYGMKEKKQINRLLCLDYTRWKI